MRKSAIYNPAFAKEDPQYSGFLEDYSGLVEEADSKLIYNYVYIKPDTDLSGYTKFLIDAITVFPHPEADFKGINANDMTLLEKLFHAAMAKALTENSGYEVVEEPGPGVCRIRVAITEVVPVRPAMNTLTTFATIQDRRPRVSAMRILGPRTLIRVCRL